MYPSEIHSKRILLSPLNWGMGHVSRCISLIDLLLKNENSIVVAASEDQQRVFKLYFPSIEYVQHEGYPFEFGKNGNFGLDLAKQFRPLKRRLKSEMVEVDQLVDSLKIELVISDHRYGFRSEKVPSIILTHQINLPVKWYESWVQKIHHAYLRAFDAVWVPDTADSSLSGQLSHNTVGLKAYYIGVLSRFSLYSPHPEKEGHTVVIVSGPDVYAKQFVQEQFAMQRLGEQQFVLIIPPSIALSEVPSNFTIQPSTDWLACDQTILSASKIISRCGYSTLMDLTILKTPFEITPTPGQREQEYLFQHWQKAIE